MGWARIDDSLHDHPKMVGLSLEALGLWVKCLAWAHRHHDSDTPGFLPLDIVKSFAGRRHVKLSAELVSRDLWDLADGNLPSAGAGEVEVNSDLSRSYLGDKSEITPSYLGDKSEISRGWWIHNYLDYLPASEKPTTGPGVRKARSAAGTAGAEARWGKNRSAKTRSTGDGNLPSDPDAPDPTRPDPTKFATKSREGVEPNEREVPLSRSFPSNVVLIANRYTERVKLSDRPKVCTVVEMALKAGYLSNNVADALDRLATDGRPVTPDTLRIEIEGRPRTNGRAPQQPGQYQPSTTEVRAGQALDLAEKYRREEEAAAATGALEIEA